APGDELRALTDRVFYKSLDALGGGEIDETAERGIALTRIAGLESFRFCREGGDERAGDRCIDNDALGRHADLALIHICAECVSGDGLFYVCIIEHHEWRLAAEFQERWLEITRGEFGNVPTDAG